MHRAGPDPAGTPAGEREAADDEREEDHVSERIRQVRRHVERATLRALPSTTPTRRHFRGADGEGCGDAVDPHPGRQ